MITPAQIGLLMPCACGATPMLPCRGAGIDADTRMHAVRVEAGLRAAAELLGLPPHSTASVAAHLRHGAEKHGATPTTSSGDQSPLDHYLALLRHIHQIEGLGERDLARRDPHSAALHLTAVVCRGLLALDGVLRELEAARG